MGSSSRYAKQQNRKDRKGNKKQKRENMKKARDSRNEQIKVPDIQQHDENPSQEGSETQGELYSAPIIPLVMKPTTHIPSHQSQEC